MTDVIQITTDPAMIVVQAEPQVITVVALGPQGPQGAQGEQGATGEDGDVVTFSTFSALAAQTSFSILASATAVKFFTVNGVSCLEDVLLTPPGSGTVVYSGDYVLEAGDSVLIGFIE